MSTNKGFISIEASIAIFIFVIFLVSYMSIIDIQRIDAYMQYSVTQSALSLSHMSYILEELNLVEHILDMPDLDLGILLENVINASSQFIDSGTEFSLTNQLVNLISFSELNVNAGFEDEELLEYLGSNSEDVLEFVFYQTFQFILNQKSENFVSLAINKYLNKLNIRNPFISIAQVDLSDSKLFSKDYSIKISMDYSLVLDLPIFSRIEMPRTVYAETRAWLGNVKASENEDSQESIWMSNDYWYRGKYIIAQEIKKESYEVVSVSGLHAANIDGEKLDVYRMFSYDCFRPSNTAHRFSRTLKEHGEAVIKKLDGLKTIELKKGDLTDKVSLVEYDIAFNVRVVLPSNTTEETYDEFRYISHEIGDALGMQVTLIKGYGDSIRD
jgi:hypothetical protein